MIPPLIDFLVCCTLFLPLVRTSHVGLGVEIHLGDTQTYRQDYDYLNPQYVRVTFSWALQEPAPGEYQWTPVLGADIGFLQDKKIVTIASVHDTPAFYRSDQRVCGPPDRVHIPELVNFVKAAVKQYPQVDVWEFWNEQDFPNGLDYYYGCWGPDNAAYYGEVLDYFYDAVKSVNPKALVMFGSIGTHTLNFVADATLKHRKFDVLGLHWYGVNTEDMQTQVNNAVKFKETLALVARVPIWITETAWLCYTWPDCDGQFKLAQADWWELIVANWDGVYPVVLWYDIGSNDWLDCGLYDLDQRKPVWYAINETWYEWSLGVNELAKGNYVYKVQRLNRR